MNQITETKTKLLSIGEGGRIELLEQEWARYKYLILAKNPNGYKAIRALLKDKSAYPVTEFYAIVDESLAMPENKGYEVNAALHVFGYFKKLATKDEKARVTSLIDGLNRGDTKVSEVKAMLYKLAEKYSEKYLLQSYYFD